MKQATICLIFRDRDLFDTRLCIKFFYQAQNKNAFEKSEKMEKPVSVAKLRKKKYCVALANIIDCLENCPSRYFNHRKF